MAIEISARKREAQGTGASRRLRRLGRVPGIVYGGAEGPVNIELDHKDLFLNLRNEKFHASILTLALEGAKQQVLLRAVNMHPFKAQVQHIDFQRVSKDKKIHMKVPLHFVNAEKSPGVKEQAITEVLDMPAEEAQRIRSGTEVSTSDRTGADDVGADDVDEPTEQGEPDPSDAPASTGPPGPAER